MSRKRGIIIGLLAAIIIAAMGICGRMAVRQDREMHAALDSLLEQNRSYVPFTTDSVARRVAAYFDHPLHFWTTSNDRLRAHYALGSVYRDLHEAPAALLAWEDGIAAADTTSKNCDFATLARVYGQMAEMYFRQYMPNEELLARNNYCKYALQAADTLMYIEGLLQRNDAYLALGDTSTAYKNIERVRLLYLNKGYNAKAASVLALPIRLYIEQGNYEQADSLMQFFELKSCLFNENGYIERGREIYYYHKGMYYLGIHQLDLAESTFRLLQGLDDLDINLYHGLLSTFRLTDNLDSTYKYSTLYDVALAAYLNQTQITAINQAKGMYDYGRQQKLAQMQERKAHRTRLMLIGVVIIGLACAIISYLYYYHLKESKKREMSRLCDSYDSAVAELRIAKHDVEVLQLSLEKRRGTEQLLEEKSAE